VSLLGYFGGTAFEEDLWRPFLIAAGVAILVAPCAELFRRAKLA
jgi:hypothetical protein